MNYQKINWNILNKKVELIPNLYLGKEFVCPDKDPYWFIYNFIIKYNKTYNTYYYYAITNKSILQTIRGRSRSFGDIYKITKHYFPEIEPIDVITTLMFLCLNSEKNNIGGFFIPVKNILLSNVNSLYCHDIQKMTFFNSDFNYNIGFYNKLKKKDEYGINRLRYLQYVDIDFMMNKFKEETPPYNII